MNISVVYSVLSLAVYFGYAICCPTGWISHETMCYRFSNDRESWIGALQMCREFGSQLVEIESSKENEFLKTEARSKHNNYWIALNDINEKDTWMWMNSKETIGSSGFTDWYSGQPNHFGAEENCAVLYIDVAHTGWRWNDLPCATFHHYICEQTA